MNAIVQTLNTAGRAFVDFAVPMLIQSSLLVLILLVVDAVLRKRVRAVLRYWIWMLVLVKLVLPPSLWSPVSVGTWLGDKLEVSTTALLQAPESLSMPSPQAELSPAVTNIFSQPQRIFTEPPRLEPTIVPPAPMETMQKSALIDLPPAPSLQWQGFALLAWGAIVAALLLLLAQRTFFVQGLVAQADEANGAMLRELDQCHRHLGLRRRVSLRLSPNAASPAICGLLRPVILVPQNLASRLHGTDLQAVLYHELAHVKRGDLWVNLVQTLLQIVYFYNPLLWLANAAVRRIREKAVDETVLVALGESAPQYPETLIHVAKLAFTRRPALSLRLIGVVESKSALTSRIRHILSHPLPKTARLGLLGGVVTVIVAAVLLPMAQAAGGTASTDNHGPLDIRLVAVCPDSGDEFYDPNGRKLDLSVDLLGACDSGPWKSEQQHRDFILHVPESDGQLFPMPFARVQAAGTDRILDGGSVFFSPGEEASTLIVSATFDRTYRRSWSGRFLPQARVERVDLPLRYFHGPRGQALCTFTGPFLMGKMVPADEGRPYQLTPETVESWQDSRIRFLFVTKEAFNSNTPVLVYDKQGRRHFADSNSGSNGSSGANLIYEAQVVSWDRVAAVTIGEKPHEIIFRNVVVRYPDRPPRAYAAYLDAMAQRLELTGLSPEQLRQYRVKSPQEAIDVLDIVRGAWNIRTTFETLSYGRPPIKVPELDRAAQEKIRQVAARWAGSDWAAHYGIQLGLLGQWPEFFDMAIDKLGRAYRADGRGPSYERAWLNANRDIAHALARSWRGLTTAQAERLRRAILTLGDGPVLNGLFGCLWYGAPEVVTDPLWDLAQDDRPWIWWKALEAWRSRMALAHREPGSLPDKIRRCLFVVEGTARDEAQKAQTAAELPRLFTPELGTMASDVWRKICERIVRDFDRKTATQVLLDYLRQMQSAVTEQQWAVDDACRYNSRWMVAYVIRTLNLWYGVDLGHLGTEEAADSFKTEPKNFAEFQHLLAQVLEWRVGNPNAEFTEQSFRGKLDLSKTTAETSARPSSAAPLIPSGQQQSSSSSGFTAALPNGVTVELLGACDYPSEGKQWWRPDGSPLAEAPYDKRGAWVSPNDRDRAPFELALRVRNLPENWEAGVQALGNTFSNSTDPPYKAGQRLPELRWLMMEAQPNQTTCTLRCNVVAPWQTLAWSSLPLTSPPPTPGSSVVFSEVRAGFGGGRVTVSGRDSSGEGVSVTVTGRVGGSNEDRLFGVGDLRRIVAITKDGKMQTAPSDGFYFAEGEQRATAYFPRLSLASVKEFQFQVRPLTWVEFRNVPLRRGLQTDVEVRVHAADAGDKAVPSAGTDQEKEIVLPEADGQRAVMLDLATGELIPWPRAESPDRMGQAILKLGKGDLVYDCDMGDRSLILLRGATSEQAQEDTGEPSTKGHLIGRHLPEILTIRTTEGRQYKITILAADDKACTLKYSPVSTGKGALELRLAPTQDKLGPSVVEECRKALAKGRTPTDHRYLWVPVRPGANLRSDLIAETHGGQTWLLLHNDDQFIMVPAQGWRLVHVARTTAKGGRPRLVLRFDESGTSKLASLTGINAGQPLATLVGGRVVDAPTIPLGRDGSSCAVIDGTLSEREIETIMTALRSLIEPSTKASSYYPPVRLHNGVIVELLGLCEYPSVGKQWWRPDGSPLPEAPYDNVQAKAFPKAGEKGYQLAVRLSSLAGKKADTYIWPSSNKTTHGGNLASIGEKNGKAQVEYLNGALDQEIVWEGVAFDEELDSCDIRVAVFRGQWTAEYWRTLGQANDTIEWAIFKDVTLRPQRQTEADQGAGGGALVGPGTVNPPAGLSAAASWQDIGSAVPPDANDVRTLAPGVVLEGSGADVEEKAFISCLRDLAQTAGQQNRFVLVTKEGQTLEPRYYTSLPRAGGKVWEKFTFDTSHLPWKLSHFQLQSRPIPADGRAVAPSPREEVLAHVAHLPLALESQPGAAGLQASGGPPGRFALSFDGAGDYLYIPDSDSLRQAAALTVEMWIKPQLPEGPHINRPRWGLLGHGAYLGTGRATVSGFGIKIDGLDPATRSLMIDYGEALEDGISCTILGELFSDNWVHISRTFGHGSYRPAPGHPMIVGRYLIPSEDPYPGQIGEIRLWDSDRAREDNIRRYENVALTGQEPGLVACWTFEEGQGQIAYDISPNANHARLGSSIEPDTADPKWVDLSAVSLAANVEAVGRSDTARGSAKPTQDTLQRLLAEARPGTVVTVPRGRHTTPLEITTPVVLHGESPDDCVIEVTADQPAILVNTKGQGPVTIENLTIRWQLASGDKVELPAAVLVKGTNAVIRNCRFAPLGDVKRSPMAVYTDGKSESTVDNCRFTGFDYVVCYGQGTKGIVQDCVIADCGHQGIINYDGATLTVQRNIITGSKFHAVRCTGGTLDVKDNLLIKNANRGIYLGNKTGRGTITNNLIVGNGEGISAFGRADYVIANNVVLDNNYAGIDMRDSCRLSIRNNVLVKNQRGLALFKEGAENFNVVAPNVFWANATDAENLEKPAGSITADPQFADPNHGDFTMRAPAREQGYGLTNPQVIKVLWEKYEQLHRDLSAEPSTRAGPVSQSSRTQTPNQPPAVLAWQRTDRYVPPDPNGFFPDDPEAGKKLDVLFRAGDRDGRSDEEILSTARRGFRRTTHSHNSVLQWIGNHFIWGKQPQNPEAIEIMYHAVPLERHYAICSGLSVVKNKSPNILYTLAAICMQGEEVGRITWGIGTQREQLLSYITPYLQDQDPAKQEMATALRKHFQGELNFESWLAGYRVRQGQLKFGPQLAQFKETLRTGDSEARYQALTKIGHNQKWVEILNDSFLPVLQTVSVDPDRRVRNEVASLAGYRWLWVTPAQPQDPSVIELMLQLSADSDRQVRYNAVYYGLSAVRDKSEPVVRRLIQLATTDPDTDLFGRIAWSLKHSLNTSRQLFERTWAGELEAATTDVQRAAIRRLYKEVLGQEPPAA